MNVAIMASSLLLKPPKPFFSSFFPCQHKAVFCPLTEPALGFRPHTAPPSPPFRLISELTCGVSVDLALMTADRQQELPTFLLARSLAFPRLCLPCRRCRHSSQPTPPPPARCLRSGSGGSDYSEPRPRFPSSGRRGRASSVMRPPVRQDEALLLLPAQPFTASHVNHTCSRCRRRIQWVGGLGCWSE